MKRMSTKATATIGAPMSHTLANFDETEDRPLDHPVIPNRLSAAIQIAVTNNTARVA